MCVYIYAFFFLSGNFCWFFLTFDCQRHSIFLEAVMLSLGTGSIKVILETQDVLLDSLLSMSSKPVSSSCLMMHIVAHLKKWCVLTWYVLFYIILHYWDFYAVCVAFFQAIYLYWESCKEILQSLIFGKCHCNNFGNLDIKSQCIVG